MATVFPFRALRPRPDMGAAVASVPYDVVNRDEARALASNNPWSFLHVTKPEIDLDVANSYAPEVYEHGKKVLDRFVAQGVLQRDRQPAYYVYELTMGAHVQTGVALCASVADYENNMVKKHELTRPDKEDDRVRHIETTQAQTGMVFLVHRHSLQLFNITTGAKHQPPLYDFVAPDQIRHRVWSISDQKIVQTVTRLFGDFGPLYIADGHHRSAAASRVAQKYRSRQPGASTYEQFLAVSFPDNEMQILPYNRVVKDLAGFSGNQFLAELKKVAQVQEGKWSQPTLHHVAMYLEQKWYTVKLTTPSSHDPTAHLDVSLLQQQVLDPILKIHNPRTDSRIDFVGGIRGDGELEKRCAAGWAVAFSMHPTQMSDIINVADADLIMPPKSTWFEPKLRDGLLIYSYDIAG